MISPMKLWSRIISPYFTNNNHFHREKRIYPINTHYIRGIWVSSLRVPSQGYHHFPYDTWGRNSMRTELRRQFAPRFVGVFSRRCVVKMESYTWQTIVQHTAGQIIVTSYDLTPNGGLVREIPLFQGNLGW